MVWGSLSIWLLVTGHIAPGVGLLLWGLMLVSWVDNIVRPLVISNATQMPFLLVVFGVLGGVLAFLSWSALVIGAFAGFVLGAVVAVVVIATRRGTGKTALPFGPFMLLGVVTGVLFGAELASAYWGVLGV
jgi:predicted PurR-regulated permease PerM